MDFSMFQSTAKSDNDFIKFLLKDIVNYDVYDFIAKTSALNLLPFNQNKSVIFDSLIDTILQNNISTYKSNNIISMKKFKDILNACMNSSISSNIDPAEMPFIQRIQFYGDFWIFCGINNNLGYNLQNLINAIFLGENNLNKMFVYNCSRMLHLVLSITNRIAVALEYNINSLGHYEKKNIDFPNSSKLNELSELLKVNIIEINELVGKENETLFYRRPIVLEEKFQSDFNFSFFYSPFLKINSSQALILNPTMLPVFAIYYIMKLAKQYSVFDELIALYNNEVWRDCRKSLRKLGHKAIDASIENVTLIDKSFYKEEIVSVSNNKLLFIRFFCDDGNEYDEENIYGVYKINTKSIKNRWRYLIKTIKKCKKDDFYQIIIINSFGRGLGLRLYKDQCKKTIWLSPFELQCVSINEREHNNFIARYIESKNKCAKFQSNLYGDFPYVTAFVDNGYSFYFYDDIDMRSTFLFPSFGDSVNYINRAIKKEDKQLVSFPNSNCLKEIVLEDEARNIYYNTSHKSIESIVRFSNIDIWIVSCLLTSIDIFSVNRSLVDLISYWFSELKDVIESLSFQTKENVIEIVLDGDIKEYYNQNNKNDNEFSECIYFKKQGEILYVHFTPSAFLNIETKDNKHEIDLVYLILQQITDFPKEINNIELFEDKFIDVSKKKIFSLDFQLHPYLKPIDTNTRKISVEYENYLLNELGDLFLKDKGMDYGLIGNECIPNFCQDVVSYLYKKLQEEVSKWNGYQLCKLIYSDLEKVMYSMMLSQKRYAFDIACYPEKSKEIFDKINETNRNSLAMKFLLEYVIATQPENNLIIGEMEYENLLTICSFIIEWAYNRDLYQYKIINSKVSLLKSGRIGIEKTQISHLTSSNYQSYNKRLNALSSPLVDRYSSTEFTKDFSEDLNAAFKDEYGYSFSDFRDVIEAIISIGDEIKYDVKIIIFSELVDKINGITNLSNEIIEKIIECLSLKKRQDYLVPPEGFSKNDIWPWVFNRRLSFTRRPMLLYGSEIIWGNRQLYHCLRFTFDLISEGKFYASKKKLKSLVGKIANQRGNEFNDVVANKLRTFDFLTIDSKVKKINGKKIVSTDNNTLGDIDVILINHRAKHIIVAEVKDFSFTKTPFEMYREYCNVFCDNGKKLCYLSKHKKRVQWVMEHIDDVVLQYRLGKGKWKVRDIFITNEVIVSNEFFHKDQPILLFSEINKSKLISL